MKIIQYLSLIACLSLAAPMPSAAQEISPQVRSFQEGEITIKVVHFGPAQHHLTVQAEAPQSLTSIQQVLIKQANTLCGKVSQLLNTQAEQRWITVQDSNARDARVRLFVAYGVVLCPEYAIRRVFTCILKALTPIRPDHDRFSCEI